MKVIVYKLDLRGKYAKLNGKRIARILRWEFQDKAAICHWQLYMRTAAEVKRVLKDVSVWTVV